MPIKKDGTGKRWVEMELIVPGSPEQVWQALATGPGNAAWFVKGEIEPRVGGAFSLDFGGGAVTSGEVTAWDPPHHFGYVERDWEPGAPPVVTEISITGRTGDRCVVRMVHSLFTSSDDWDDQIENFESGWPGFFAVLRAYLTHFAGQAAASFIKMTPVSGNLLTVWSELCEALGIAGANVGEQRSTSAGPEPWSASVEHVYQDTYQRYVLLCLEAPTPGLALIGCYGKGKGTNISISRYCYGEQAEAQATASEAAWRDWLAANFTAAAVTGAAAPVP